MSLKKNALATVALTGIAVAVSSAYAAGFQLTEQSSLGLGRAYAGAGVVGDDLSAVHYNVAGMTLLPGTRIQAGSVYIDVDAPFTGDDGTKENGRLKGQAIPAGYITHQINDKLWFGLGMTVPFGMGTEYNKDWRYATAGNESMVMTIDINPSIAYKVNDFVSVGAGLSIQYAKAELGKSAGYSKMAFSDEQLGINLVDGHQAFGKVKADSWDWGWNVGVMVQPCETVRLGLSYRSAVEHNAEGDFTLSGKLIQAATGGLVDSMTYGDAKVYVKTPDTVYFTGTWEATQDLRISGLIRWAKWSNFDRLDIYSAGAQVSQKKNPNEPASASEHNWDDTWLFSLGADYRLNNEWTIRGGIAYETGAIEPQYRTATIPDADRVWLTAGATYNYSKQIQFDFGAAYLRGIGNKDLWSHNAVSEPFGDGHKKIGEYDSIDAFILGAQVQYRF